MCVHFEKYICPLLRAFFLIYVLLGCSSIKIALYGEKQIIVQEKIPKDFNKDYSNHLMNLEKSLRNNPKIGYKKVSSRGKRYLREIFLRIQANNELLISKGIPNFIFINDRTPYIFSLPGFKIFISTGLLRRYLKNESLLISALVYHFIKSSRNLYPKKLVIPTGVIEIPEILSLTRLPLSKKVEIYKWSYFALKRAEYDGSSILNWIQTQNKNTLDFSWLTGDTRGASREEFLFKSFLVSQGIDNTSFNERNSSTGFYYLRDTM